MAQHSTAQHRALLEIRPSAHLQEAKRELKREKVPDHASRIERRSHVPVQQHSHYWRLWKQRLIEALLKTSPATPTKARGSGVCREG